MVFLITILLFLRYGITLKCFEYVTNFLINYQTVTYLEYEVIE